MKYIFATLMATLLGGCFYSVSAPSKPATPEALYTYVAKLPCASCEKIDSILTFNADATFSRVDDYVGGKGSHKVKDVGNFISTQDILTITTKEGEITRFKIVDKGLLMLDKDGLEPKEELRDSYIYTLKK